MGRNMDLVREILLCVEGNKHLSNAYAPTLGLDPDDAPPQPGIPDIEGYDTEAVLHHCYFLADAGLVTVWRQGSELDLVPWVIPHCLTWEGHEFIANTREESRWDLVKQQAGSASFEIVRTVALSLAKSALNLG